MATFVVYRDIDGLYAWRLKAGGDGRVLAVQSGYSKQADLLEDLDELRQSVDAAGIVDLTGE